MPPEICCRIDTLFPHILLDFPDSVSPLFRWAGHLPRPLHHIFSFDFVPKCVIIINDSRSYLGFRGSLAYVGQTGISDSYNARMTFSGKTMSWYSNDSSYGVNCQCNEKEAIYFWIALA